MSDGCVVPRDALFVPSQLIPNNALLVGVGYEVDDDVANAVRDFNQTHLGLDRSPIGGLISA